MLPLVDILAQTQERLDGIWDRLGKIMDRIGDGIRARLCEIPDQLEDGPPDRLDQVWDRLMFRYYPPKKGSVAELAELHAFVREHRNDTVPIGNEKVPRYPHITAALDSKANYALYQATHHDDVTHLRKYISAVEMAKTGERHKLDLTAQTLVAWRELRNELGRPPGRTELKNKVTSVVGAFTPRQWRRVLEHISELI